MIKTINKINPPEVEEPEVEPAEPEIDPIEEEPAEPEEPETEYKEIPSGYYYFDYSTGYLYIQAADNHSIYNVEAFDAVNNEEIYDLHPVSNDDKLRIYFTDEQLRQNVNLKITFQKEVVIEVVIKKDGTDGRVFEGTDLSATISLTDKKEKDENPDTLPTDYSTNSSVNNREFIDPESGNKRNFSEIYIFNNAFIHSQILTNIIAPETGSTPQDAGYELYSIQIFVKEVPMYSFYSLAEANDFLTSSPIIISEDTIIHVNYAKTIIDDNSLSAVYNTDEQQHYGVKEEFDAISTEIKNKLTITSPGYKGSVANLTAPEHYESFHFVRWEQKKADGSDEFESVSAQPITSAIVTSGIFQAVYDVDTETTVIALGTELSMFGKELIISSDVDTKTIKYQLQPIVTGKVMILVAPQLAEDDNGIMKLENSGNDENDMRARIIIEDTRVIIKTPVVASETARKFKIMVKGTANELTSLLTVDGKSVLNSPLYDDNKLH